MSKHNNLPPGVTANMIEAEAAAGDDFTFDALCNELEAIVDKHSLYIIVEALAHICHEKEDHIRSNWGQESLLANLWKNAGQQLSKLDVQV